MITKKAGVATSECYFLIFLKNYEISTNVNDKNTKFTTKSEAIVIYGSCEIFIYIYIL